MGFFFLKIFQDTERQNSEKLEKDLQESRWNYPGQFCLHRAGLQ